ncbi:hypothetical protein [Sphingosinicella sp. LY1275]|uniref:hypothetical protein n=1 Tax=Sphingosinicella sp. LY1275 TaxID=3095379 RepID=UPI002ADEF22D|nr:hypothetical protein [Sphingosinicella sp. LY1275]MEA1013726.1 hypothetical protein [Sphingosinicella sp. LY1275]
MKLPGPAASCLLIGAVGGAFLWMLGEKTSAVIIFACEALGWAALYAATDSKE